MNLTLDELLQKLDTDADTTEKTASEKPASQTDAKREDLSTALRGVQEKLASTQTPEKEKGEATPLTDLAKMASEIGDLDYKTLVKEANLYGAGVADGFVGRLNEYNGVEFSKVASENDVPDHVVEKIAHDAIQGFLYAQQEEMEKQASDPMTIALDGYIKTAAEIEKVALDVYAIGRDQCARALGLEKSAATQQMLPGMEPPPGMAGRAAGAVRGAAGQAAGAVRGAAGQVGAGATRGLDALTDVGARAGRSIGERAIPQVGIQGTAEDLLRRRELLKAISRRGGQVGRYGVPAAAALGLTAGGVAGGRALFGGE